MVKTELTTAKGATRATWAYIVAGHRPEPLLGGKDAERLGIVTFNPEGREPTEDEAGPDSLRKIEDGKAQTTSTREKDQQSMETAKDRCIPDKLRAAGFKVDTGRPQIETVTPDDKEAAKKIAARFYNSVFLPGIGCVKTEPVKLEFEEGFKPEQPPRRGVPYHYQGRLSQHLDMMRKEGAIEDVNPREPLDCVMNVVITDKKESGQIRMNIDATPLNKGMKMTKYHVKTAAEVRHELEGAAIFSELDMGYGFHQLPLHPDTAKQAVFQTHEGIHRMKRLFFGPRPASGIFHHEVSKCFRGLQGVTTIHDNILVYGATVDEHHRNLEACLQRAEEKGVRLKLSKSTFCSSEVSWFGRIFSGTGMSADPTKIAAIIEAGRPRTMEDVRSFLQACAYNAKFSFDHSNHSTYQEVTAPLREMLKAGARFSWTKEREHSYQTLISILSDKATLRPFRRDRPTHFISDASPKGIAASVYQEEEDGTLVPVDHVDRALSAAEQAWQSQIEWESLAKAWGMRQLRAYLVGSHFTSWGDHAPLVPLYNSAARPASRRITKHRQQVQDLFFTDKYLTGKQNPCDFKSRFPTSLSGLSPADREKLEVDDNDSVQVMRILVADLPPALSIDRLKEAAIRDETYQSLVQVVTSGSRPPRDGKLLPYIRIWSELSVLDGLVMRGERIVIPDADLGYDVGNMRQWVVELGHEGHVGAEAAKRLLRKRLWFPGMDSMVDARTRACLACSAATHTPHRDPLRPTKAPVLPFTRVAADHWGPTPCGRYVLVVIDLLTRYVEVEVVKGTSAEDNIHALDNIFSRHNPPEVLLTDSGPPFNTGPNHPLQRYFAAMGIERRTTISAEDPEANGACEAFMKHLKKIWHTSYVQHRDPILDINRHLRSVRATPHPTTGAIPAELLFGRKFRTVLPDLRPNPAARRPDILQARRKDEVEKCKMKVYKDKPAYVKSHTIRVGDKVLLRQKSTKRDPPYDPEPYTVVDVHGTQVTGDRGRGVTKTRDSQRWKKVDISLPPVIQSSATCEDGEADIGLPEPPGPSTAPTSPQPTNTVPLRNPTTPSPARPADRPAATPTGRPRRIRRPPNRWSPEPM